MKVLHFLLTVAVTQVVLANRFLTPDDDDSTRVTGTTGINFEKKEYSSVFQTKSQQSSSANVAFKAPHPPTMTHAKPKPPTVRLPGHAGVIAMPRPDVISDLHPSAYIAHNAGPQVHLLKDEKHHLEVLQLSNGLQAVPLDDRFGRVTDYLYLGREINLVPGGTIFYLQATDLIDGHTTFVNMGTQSGHLSLSEIRIGNTVQQGFKGVDDIGPVFIPVVRRSQRLQVNPVVYRTDRLSSYKSFSSSRFYSSASVDDSPFYHIVS